MVPTDKSAIEIVPFAACQLADRCNQIDAIFFEASTVQSFESSAARTAFHWLWLGRYLADEPEHSFVAIAERNRIVGYLAGSISDPAQRPEFDELLYFKAFEHVTAHYPAHFHINVAGDIRSAGVGSMLIDAFISHASGAGATGMHIVTGKDMRNVGFYTRNGFKILATTLHGTRELAFLARKLSAISPIS